jgi:hypothetical protein
MRGRCAVKFIILTTLAMLATGAPASQIQAFKSSPARPATAAHDVAKEQPESHPESPEARTERAFNEARANNGSLYALLKEMPKGGDLHNHLTGAVYAENLIRFAAESNLCIDRVTFAAAEAPCQPNQFEAREAQTDMALYGHVIDAWSMREIKPGSDGHDHFFETFGKFNAATEAHLGQILAEVERRAADGNVQYMELMLSPDHGQASALGLKVGFDSNLGTMRQKLLAEDFASIVTAASKNLDAMEQSRNGILKCASEPEPHGGPCAVHVRYIYSISRSHRPEQVFAQMVMGFELASHDPRVVSLNLVEPEDWRIPMEDFHLHMQMLSYLRGIYPNVHLTLHAGELRPGLVPPDGLRFHIRESVEVAKAERIGHGVDVMYEENPHELLATMARRNVMVEICLTSNEGILGVRGKQHPLAMYLKAGVPVALATDDEGVSRSEMTREYERAVLDQGLDYATLKKMTRTSIEHSFLPGASLWSDAHKYVPVHECSGEKIGWLPAASCLKFLNSNEKAREEWRLERRLAEFESKF